MYTKLHLNDKLKHASGFVSHLLECVASTGISMLFCLASKHADIVSFNGKKKTKHMFKMLRAGGAGTEQIRKQIWRQKRSTNLKKNAPLLTKEISSVKSISFKHVLLSANRRLTWGVPSDRSGCGTRYVRLDPSLVDFVTYKSKERENWNMKGRKSRAASSNNL